MATSTASTTTPFRRTHELQTTKASTKALVSRLPESRLDANEAQYWADKFGLGDAAMSSAANYRLTQLEAGSAAVVHQMEFVPCSLTTTTTPLATACGPRVRLFGTTSSSAFHTSLHQPPRSFHNKKQMISSDKQIPTGHLSLAVAFRNDGRLLAIACENGHVKVVDRATRAVLTTWIVSSLPIRSVVWFRNGQNVLVAGDDGRVSVWDLKQPKKAVWTGIGHGDAIRCAQLWQWSSSTTNTEHSASTQSQQQPPAVTVLAATASYDHTVRIWNLMDLASSSTQTGQDNDDRCLSVLHHDAPVETLLFLPSESHSDVPVWLITCSGTVLRIWNPLTGQQAGTCPTHHAKTVTSILSVFRKDYDNDNQFQARSRLLTGGLDGTLRVYDWREPQVVPLHSIASLRKSNDESSTTTTTAAITSLAATPNSDRLAIGWSDGTVWVRQRGPRIQRRKRARDPPAGTYAYFMRGQNVTPSVADYTVTSAKKKSFKPYDLALKQFQYGDALDEALATRVPATVLMVLEELGRRDGLRIALQNRDEELLEPVLSFVVRYVARPRYTPVLLGVTELLLELYDRVTGQSETIDELFLKLRMAVTFEIQAQKVLLRTLGQVDLILGASSLQYAVIDGDDD